MARKVVKSKITPTAIKKKIIISRQNSAAEARQEKKAPEKAEKEVLEDYQVSSLGTQAGVKIIRAKGMLPSYELSTPKCDAPTLALMDSIRSRLITSVNIGTKEVLDPDVVGDLKERFRKQAVITLDKELPGLAQGMKSYLVTMLVHDMLGMGDIEFLLNDQELEEIVINTSREPVMVYHKNHGWLRTNIFIRKESTTYNYANTIARRIGRQITSLTPLLDAHLVTQDRANAILYPISSKGNTITIRKFARDPWTMTDFMNNGTTSPEILAMIWQAIQYEMNVIISGGTASGKTSFMNVCMPFMPPNHRIITIEDTRELQLPEFLYWCPLVTRKPNPEGKGEVTMLDLLVNSLRMRPDRIVLGEVRQGKEAEVMFEAMHTGHSVYATVHADTSAQTIRRLTGPPINVPPEMLEAVNLNVVMFRNRRTGKRKTFQISEFLRHDAGGKTEIRANILYRWQPSDDTLVKHAEGMRFKEDLVRHTGLSEKELNDDLAQKKRILTWMAEQNIRALAEVGKVMNKYYMEPESVLNAANLKMSAEEFFGK